MGEQIKIHVLKFVNWFVQMIVIIFKKEENVILRLENVNALGNGREWIVHVRKEKLAERWKSKENHGNQQMFAHHPALNHLSFSLFLLFYLLLYFNIIITRVKFSWKIPHTKVK